MTAPTSKLIQGDCLHVMAGMEPDSVDAIVTDPPYGLGFMGKEWDHGVPGVPFWEQALRVLKPGGHLIAFAGSRTYHRLACAVEDAGFEVRDQILWVYGSGFPKSMDISKAIDKAAGAEREVVGKSRRHGGGIKGNGTSYEVDPSIPDITAPATPEAQQWSGWGTALKPAHEPAVLARKPFKGTVAANVLTHGTGGINVDGCRVGGPGAMKWEKPRGGIWATDSEATAQLVQNDQGRWPANLIHDGSDEVVALFPQVDGSKGTGLTQTKARSWKNTSTAGINRVGHDDTGSAARFFYTAKAGKAERGKGNNHPTVKPLDLMAYLCRLVTPPGGTVLDPFMGSGTTIKAALSEGFNAVGIELDPAYFEIVENRMDGAQLGLGLPLNAG
jgi:DNA modification methylase